MTMVNYCCVLGCRRNSRANKYLNYYSLPRNVSRQKQWLKAAGKEDLLEKDLEKLQKALRFCSRHFLPNFIKNRHLTEDAVPSKYLPGSLSKDEDDNVPATHERIICDNCLLTIVGFRYKCVSCDNYDLCQKCEMQETHGHHYMLRIPCSLTFNKCEDLISKWRQFFKSEHIVPKQEDTNDLSSDDEPVKKYMTKTYSAFDISDDIKKSIQIEVKRAMKVSQGKRAHTEKVMYPSKSMRMQSITTQENQGIEDKVKESKSEPQLVLVIGELEDVKFSQNEIKTEDCPDGPQPEDNDNLRAFYSKMGIDLSQLMMEAVPNSEEPS